MLQLFGAFYTARCAARAFIKLGIKGAIVFTASMASYRPNKVREAVLWDLPDVLLARC